MTHPAIRRQQAAQAVLDQFKGRQIDYRDVDCGRMAKALLLAMGHKPRWARFSGYTTERGAVLKLKRAGFNDVAAVVDDLGFPRVPFSMAMRADLLGFPDGGWTALGVAMGGGKFLAARGSDQVFEVGGDLPPHLMDQAFAWRVEPR